MEPADLAFDRKSFIAVDSSTFAEDVQSHPAASSFQNRIGARCVPEMIREKREVTRIKIAHDHNQAAFTSGIRVTRKHGLHERGCFAVRCICGRILAAHRLQAPEQFEPAWYQI